MSAFLTSLISHTAWFTRLVNHLLSNDPQVLARLLPYAGSVLELSASPWAVRVRIEPDGFISEADSSGSIDVTIAIVAAEILTILAKPDMAMSKVSIVGDADLAALVGYLFKHLRWDAEDDLARIVGDEPAVHLLGAVNFIKSSIAESVGRFTQTAREYAVYEQPIVVDANHFRSTVVDVKTLRDATERLEKRIAKLQNSFQAVEKNFK